MKALLFLNLSDASTIEQNKEAGSISKADGAMDYMGVTLSTMCLIHCIALPLMPMLLTTQAAPIFENEMVHKTLLAIVTPIAIIALWRGRQRHGKTWVLALGFSAVALLIAAVAAAPLFGELFEKGGTVVGSIALAAAHIFNRSQKAC